MDALVLQGADQLQASAVADVGEAAGAVGAERSLVDTALAGAVEDGTPALELQHPLGGLLGEELDHPPVVDVLAALPGVGEVEFPVVVVVDVAKRRRDPALGHDRVGLAEQRLADDRGLGARLGGGDRGSQARAAGADDDHVVVVGLVLRLECLAHLEQDPRIRDNVVQQQPDIDV